MKLTSLMNAREHWAVKANRAKYQSEEAYDAAMDMINKQPEIQILFQEFQSVLVEKSEITEEDFFEIQII